MLYILTFIFGGAVGMICMALCTVSGRDERTREKIFEEQNDSYRDTLK